MLPPPLDHFGHEAALIDMAPWIDRQAAERLWGVGINVGKGYEVTKGTIWNAMIAKQNPHRYEILH